ncbi:MAG: DUF1538 domain-containing protein [Clostridia bacterium]|nr:DUF1538 domain-containing protein [Clostridia bacterium]
MGVILHKLRESARSILPICAIVALLAATFVPMDPGTFLMFAVGTALLIIGMAVFTLGAEMSMQQLGTKIGTTLAGTGKVWLIAFASFLIGVVVTVAEPDLQILAGQVSGVENLTLILTVSLGVGLFLVIALMRTLLGIPLSVLLTVFYAAAFILCLFVPDTLYCIAFDSGGVTTGPMTVPFLMALGAGVSSSAGKGARDDSFSIVSLCSVGPIIAVLILGAFTEMSGGEYTVAVTAVESTRESVLAYGRGLFEHVPDVGAALIPIFVFAVLFQIIFRPFGKDALIRIVIGMFYVFAGLVLFLTGADIGFLPVGYTVGSYLAGLGSGAILVPVAMVLGFFIVKAEPAVYVLNRQVEVLTAGSVSGKTVGRGLSFGVAAALGLSVLRVLTGLPIMYILIPGYALAILLTFFVPRMFVGIAFDSGGVASGTMMSAFVLPMTIGACTTLGGDVMTEAFGCVAFVALTPIISIQICGLLNRFKQKHTKDRFVSAEETFLDYSADFAPAEGGSNGK